MITNRDRKSFGSRRKKIQIYSDDWHRWRFWSAFRHFGTHFAESFRMSKSSWMMDPSRSREMPSCSAIDLVEIRRSSKISSWNWSLISGVVAVLGRPGRGASQFEKSPSFWRWHTMVHVSIMFLSEWREFPSAHCLAEKKNLMTAHVSMLLKSRALLAMLPFGLCNKKRLVIRHTNRPPLSKDTIDSVLWHREVGGAKDLSAPSLTLGDIYMRGTKLTT